MQAVERELNQMMHQLHKSSKPPRSGESAEEVERIAKHRHLTAEELSIFLQVPVKKVHALARSGMIPRIKLTNKIVRFDLEKVLRAMNRFEIPAKV